MDIRLSAMERQTLLNFIKEGPGGDFDQRALANLFTKGLLRLRSRDRSLTLTEEGRKICASLRDGSKGSAGDGRSSRSR
jgi:hypothetical protein